MILHENISLKSYNTFGVNAFAKELIEFQEITEVYAFFKRRRIKPENLLILGSGSNILFINDFKGTIVRLSTFNRSIVGESRGHVWVKGEAGILWHDFVTFTIDSGYQGLENLSLIPGTLGAAPVQNIGAYGVEQKDYFESANVFDIQTGEVRTFKNRDCKFGYRESMFKNEFRGRFIILDITFKLNKKPDFHTSYKDLQAKISEKKIQQINAGIIRSLIIEIRRSKLPDPSMTGNAGSFFKNPRIDKARFDKLKEDFPAMPGYPFHNRQVKIPAAWLIESCGWKGFTRGQAGVYSKQPLVLINLGNASGKEIYALANEIRESVKKKFDISLDLEIRVI